MNLYRISTSLDPDDGGRARADVFDVEADAIAVSRTGGIRAWVERPAPSTVGRWAAWRQRRRLERDPHAFDELTCWVPSDTLISARKLTPAEAPARVPLRPGGVVRPNPSRGSA